MNKILKLIISVVLFVVLFLFPGCVERFTGEGTEIDSVKIITPEEIESIFAELSNEMTEKYPVETDEDGNITVFWLDGGSVWHISIMCGNIQKADPSKVYSGSIEEAHADGKARACKICSKNEIIDDSTDFEHVTSEVTQFAEVTQTTETIVVDDCSIVYWVKNGSVWHLYQSCKSLARTDDSAVISGSVCDAYSDGKTRGCKVCAKNVNILVSIPEETKQNQVDQSHETDADTTEKYIKEYDTNGKLIVFWTENGNVWHESRFCASLARSDPDKILSGSEFEATASGKERVCKKCS